MVTQQAAAAAATHLGWEERDGTLYILESSDEGEEQDDAVQQEEADVTPPAISGGRLPEGAEDAQLMPEEDGLLPERPSWRIAGHQWVTQGDINGPPPRGTEDLLVSILCMIHLGVAAAQHAPNTVHAVPRF